MKLASAAVALTALLPFAQALSKGFNIAATRPDGSCKSEADWEYSFGVMKRLPGGFHSVRLYASSDCSTLARAVPAAQRQGIQLLAGVWTEDAAHYAAEKAALSSAIRTHGAAWLLGVSVGSEDLYRGDTTAAKLASQIYDVRGMLSKTVARGKPVGHVDTWTAWVNDANAAVLKASAFIGMDGYPYFQGSKISNARNVFYQSLTATQAAVQRHSPGKPIWITETGWPAHGPNFGAAVSSVGNAQYYWHHVMCGLFSTHNTWAYTLRDYNAAPAGPSFGVVGENFRALYNLAC